MARLIVNVGTNENDGTGDNLRNAMVKINQNFEEVYSLTAGETNIGFTPNAISATNINGNLTLSPNGTGTLIIASGAIINSDAQSDSSAQLIVKDSTNENMLVVDPLTKSIGINTVGTSRGLFVSGNAAITGTSIALSANVALGASGSNTVTMFGKMSSSILANLNETYDIGSNIEKFRTAYLNRVESAIGNIGTLTANTIVSQTVTSTYAILGNITLSSTLIDPNADVLSIAATVSARAVKGTTIRESLAADAVLTHPLNTLYSYSPSSNGFQVELDSASGHSGGAIHFINRSGSNTYSILAQDSSLVATVGTNASVTVISDGVSWFQI